MDAVREFDAKPIIAAVRGLNLDARHRERFDQSEVRKMTAPLRGGGWQTNVACLDGGGNRVVQIMHGGQETPDALILEIAHGGLYRWSAFIRSYWLDLPTERWWDRPAA